METNLKFEKWAHLYDNARYLGVEYRQKEKEYGIKWREAFREELKIKMDFLVGKYGKAEDVKERHGQIMTDYYLDVIFSLVSHSFREASDGNIDDLDDHLVDYDAVVTYLRQSLKDNDLHFRIQELRQARELQLKEEEKQKKVEELEQLEKMRNEHHFFIF